MWESVIEFCLTVYVFCECRYMAPEVFRHELYNNKVDVYR